MSTCCSSYLPFQKNLTFLLFFAEHGPERGQKEEKKNGFNYRKRGPVRTSFTIAETIQLIVMLYGFFFFFEKEHFAPLILVNHF